MLPTIFTPNHLRPRMDRYAGGGLAFGHRVRERVPAVDTGAVGG